MKNFKFEKKYVNDQINSLKKIKVDPNNIVLNAAAFQDQLMHKLGLGGIRKKVFSSRIQLKSRSKKPQEKEKCQNLIEKLNNKESNSDQEIIKRNKKFLSALTFAEKAGIEKINNFPLSLEQWKKLENQSVKREDFKGECPICLEKLCTRDCVILSCSHVFHKVCLKNFEKFTAVTKCPLCRCEKYECKAYTKDKEYFVKKSIIIIQSDYRGYRLRHYLYINVFKNNMPKSKLLRNIYSKWRFNEIADRLMKRLKKEEEANAIMFNQCVKKYEDLMKLKRENNELEKKVFGKEKNNENKKDGKTNWNEVIDKMEKRENETCAICLCNFGHKQLYILDCTHCFHKNCLDSFERFDPYYIKRCPICRAEYTKKQIKK